MAAPTEGHVLASQELLAKALDAVQEGDLLQASGKGWRTAAQMLKGLAEKRGWGRYGDRQLYQAVDSLAQKSGDGRLRVLFSVASALNNNSRENTMPKEMVAEELTQVKQFLVNLEGLA